MENSQRASISPFPPPRPHIDDPTPPSSWLFASRVIASDTSLKKNQGRHGWGPFQGRQPEEPLTIPASFPLHSPLGQAIEGENGDQTPARVGDKCPSASTGGESGTHKSDSSVPTAVWQRVICNRYLWPGPTTCQTIQRIPSRALHFPRQILARILEPRGEILLARSLAKWKAVGKAGNSLPSRRFPGKQFRASSPLLSPN